jgi:hypothetical protein
MNVMRDARTHTRAETRYWLNAVFIFTIYSSLFNSLPSALLMSWGILVGIPEFQEV